MSQTPTPSELSKKLKRYVDKKLSTKEDGVLDAVSLIALNAKTEGARNVANRIKEKITDGKTRSVDAFGSLDADKELLLSDNTFAPGAYPFANVKQKGTLFIRFEDVLEGLNRYYNVNKRNLEASDNAQVTQLKQAMKNANGIDDFARTYADSEIGVNFKEVMDALLPQLNLKSSQAVIDQSTASFQMTDLIKKARLRYRNTQNAAQQQGQSQAQSSPLILSPAVSTQPATPLGQTLQNPAGTTPGSTSVGSTVPMPPPPTPAASTSPQPPASATPPPAVPKGTPPTALRDDIQYDVDLLSSRMEALNLLKPRFFTPTKYTGEGKYDTTVVDYFYNAYKQGGIQDTEILKSPQDLLHEELDDDLRNFGIADAGFFEVSSYDKSSYVSEKDYHMEMALSGKEDQKLKRIFARGKDYVNTVIDNYKGPKESLPVMRRLDFNDTLISSFLKTTMIPSNSGPDAFELVITALQGTSAYGTLMLMLVCPEIIGLALSKKMLLTPANKPLPVKIIVAAQEKIHQIMYMNAMTEKDFMHAVYLIDLILMNNLSVSTPATIATGSAKTGINYIDIVIVIMSATAIKMRVGIKFKVFPTSATSPLEYILGDPTKVLKNATIEFAENTSQFSLRLRIPFTPGDDTFTKPLLNRFFDHETGKARSHPTNAAQFDESQIFALERTVEAYKAGWNSAGDTSYFVKKVNSVNNY
jgi:hypothetical protein